MDRDTLLLKAYARGSSLTIENMEYLDRVRAFTTAMVEEDIREIGDITSDSVLVDMNPYTRASLVSKAPGVVAGVEEVRWFYSQFGVTVEAACRDGVKVGRNQTILRLGGKCKDLLLTERTGLNLLQRMSGIATLTHHVVEKVRDTGLHVAATRKTQWGALDNKAVAMGGGLTHRLGLWESILIKENHLTILKKHGYEDTYIEEALERAWHCPRKNFIEIEVQTHEEAHRAAHKFQTLLAGSNVLPCIIMLDNFPVDDLKMVMDEMKTEGYYPEVLFEASGLITPESIIHYTSTGVDVVSMGSLTHSPHPLDISQLLE